jgi:GT2 family glycosyltransferase
MVISAIIPAFNASAEVRECLAALMGAQAYIDEILVVDDASADDTAAVAAATGARVVRLEHNRGPAGARNAGAAAARGDVLWFVDADVVVAPDAAGRIARVFASEPDVAAVFGSYDTRPRAPGVVSQYRNLLHHYVHQHATTNASTFWAGCGAVRRTAFEQVGGFDPRPSWHFIEDIELGYRLRSAGHRIQLDKELHATHLKRWTLRGVLRTDTFFRAAPWTRLIRRTATVPADLNLGGSQRLSVALAGLATLSAALAFFEGTFVVATLAFLLALVLLNSELYRFFYRERSFIFMVATIPLHVLYFLCCGAGFVYGCVTPTTDSSPTSSE